MAPHRSLSQAAHGYRNRKDIDNSPAHFDDAAWQWSTRTGWQNYEPHICEQLTIDKYLLNKHYTTIRLPHGLYSVDFNERTQRSFVGGMKRNIRENHSAQASEMAPRGNVNSELQMPTQSLRRGGACDRGKSVPIQRKHDYHEKDFRLGTYSLSHSMSASPKQIRDIVHPLFGKLELKRGTQGSRLLVRAGNGDPAGAIMDMAKELQRHYSRSPQQPIILTPDRGVEAEMIMAGLSLGLFLCGVSDRDLPSFQIDETANGSMNNIQDTWDLWSRMACSGIPDYDLKPLPSYGGYEWIRTDNSAMIRLERLVGATSTLRYSFEMPAVKELVKRTQLLPDPSDEEGQNFATASNNTSVEYAENGTVLERAIAETRSGYKVAAVSAASAYQVGGGFLTGGRHALEEAACMQSTLFFSLQKAAQLAERRRLNDKIGKPIHVPESGAVLSPKVSIFREGTMEGYRWRSKAEDVHAVISVAMPNQNRSVHDSPFDFRSRAQWQDLVEQKFKAVLTGAQKIGAEVLVIPDVGCGVFKNDPSYVGHVLGTVLNQYFDGVFEKVILTGSREFERAVRRAYIPRAGSAQTNSGTFGKFDRPPSASSRHPRSRWLSLL